MANKVYDYVTEKIIKLLESGVIPWHKPWTNSLAINYVTRKAYRGINSIMLDGGEYLSFKQIQDLNGTIKKGSKAHMVVFYKIIDKKTDEADETEDKKSFVLRYYNVYHINDVEGIPSKIEGIEHEPLEEAEKIIKNFSNSPKIINENLNEAFYSPSRDIINMPLMKQFKLKERYYSTLFHEAVHSTGHISRLKRFTGDAAKASFGSETYSKEELIAELGSAMLCNVCGIDNTIEENAAYIDSWLKVLKDDKKFVVQAAGSAQKAVDYILGVTYSVTE